MQRRRQRHFLISLLMLMALLGLAVSASFSQSPKTQLPSALSPEQVLSIIQKYHPVVRQAGIEVNKNEAAVTSARGFFDPILQTGAARKTFDGAVYYNYVQPELKIPTWYGIELTAGAEYLSGSRTDPRETLGKTSYAGLSIPLAKNLLMDKRRAALQQSKIFVQLSNEERRSRVNNLLFEAMEAYWQWAKEYRLYQLASEAVQVSEKRLQLVRTAFINGDRAALDTTEALTQLQAFRYMQNESYLAVQLSAIDLSVFLWKENNEPYMLPAAVMPDAGWNNNNSAPVFPRAEEMVQTALLQHPDLTQYNYKLDALEVERKLKFQELLPSLQLKYNNLGKGYNLVKTATTPLLENNYQYGISFSMPLRLSQGRGDYRQTRLKITETKLDRSLKEQEVQNKIMAGLNELTVLKQQLELLENNYRNYQALLRGEEARFFNGESSLFLVNSRETKVLEAASKLAETKAKYFKTIYKVQWAAGLLAL